MTLLLLMVIPLLTAALVVVMPSDRAKHVALVGTLVAMAATVYAMLQFSWEPELTAADQFSHTIEWIPSIGLTLSVGADSVSMLLVALTSLLGPICVWGSYSAITDKQKTFYAWLLILQAAVTGVFCARDMVLFYVCFEFTLIPMYVLISLFGSTNRKKAATKFFLYTFTGSIITLAGVVYVAWQHAANTGDWSFAIGDLARTARDFSLTQQSWVMLALLLGFAVKVPLFPVHTWLPLAHTEAPTAGSVVLAGVLLKLGTYGIYKFVLGFTPLAIVEFAPLLAVLAIIGIVYAGLVCWVQKDFKKLVAYSSVSHLGFCMLGLFALNEVGITGSVLYMINHGLSTGALFLMIGMMYERYHTRAMREVGGLGSKMPVWSFFMVFFVMASVGLPGTNGFVSEIMCLMGTFQAGDWSSDPAAVGGTDGVLGPWFAAIAGTGMVVAAIYLLFMTGKLVWGEYHEPRGHHAHEVLPTDLNRREIALLVPLALLCLGLGLYPKPMMKAIEQPVAKQVAIVERAIDEAAAARDESPETVELAEGGTR